MDETDLTEDELTRMWNEAIPVAVARGRFTVVGPYLRPILTRATPSTVIVTSRPHPDPPGGSGTVT